MKISLGNLHLYKRLLAEVEYVKTNKYCDPWNIPYEACHNKKLVKDTIRDTQCYKQMHNDCSEG